MRDWTGGPWHLIEDKRSRDFAGAVDYFLRDLSRGIERIQQGQVPDGSGNPIPVGVGGALEDYLFLPGRPGGQISHAVDANPGVTFASLSTAFAPLGSIGDPIVRFSYGDSVALTPLLDIRPYHFGTAPEVIEVMFTNGAAAGVSPLGTAVNFLSDDGTSALRISSSANRTFLQAGLKISTGHIQNANMTIGAGGSRVAASLAYEFERITIANTAAPIAATGATAVAKSTRIGINIRPDEYAGSAATVKGASLHLGDLATSNTPTWPAATDPAALILENSGQVTDRHLFELRTSSTGVSTTKQIGSVGLALAMTESSDSTHNLNGQLKFYWGGSFMSKITAGSSNSALDIRDSSDVVNFRFQKFTTWVDSVNTSIFEPGGVTSGGTGRLMLVDSNGSALLRLGICATSIVIGNTFPARLPAPTGSRLLTFVDTANPGVPLSGHDSAGAYFLLAGAAAGKLLQSDSGGVGSWGLTLSGNYTLSGAITINGTLGPSALAPTFQWPNDSSTAFLVVDDTAGNTMSLGVTGVVAGGATANIPATGGTLITTAATQTLSNKTVSQGVASQSTDLTPVSVAVTNVIATPTSGAFTWTLIVFVTVADVTAGTYQVDLGWTDSNGARTASSGAIPLTATSQNTFTGVGQRQSGAITFTRTLTAGAGTSKIRYFIRIS